MSHTSHTSCTNGAAPARPEAEAQLVLLSADDPALLDEHAGDVLDALDHCAAPTPPPLSAVAHTLGAREPLTARLAVVAGDTEEFVRRLRRARVRLADGARGDLGHGTFAADAPLPAGRRRVAFLFPGQDGHHSGTARELYGRFPGFRTALDTLAAAALRDTGLGPGGLLHGDGCGTWRAAPLRVSQPLHGTVQLAATRLLADCGVTPGLALGHGDGEFAAAAAAGALSGEDTVRLLGRRGAALQRAADGVGGGMVVVQSDRETCRRLVRGIDGVWLACFNQPYQTVVSGTGGGLAALRRVCADAGVVTAALGVSHAQHSPRLAPAGESVRADLARRPVARPVVPFVSCVDGAVCDDPERLRELWVRHASVPVRFGDAVRTAYDEGARVFLQVTGGGSLLSSVGRGLADRAGVHLVPGAGATQDGGRDLASALARLAVLGVPVDPGALVRPRERRTMDLPGARRRQRAGAGAPAGDPMEVLLRAVRQQAALIARLIESLPR